MRQTNPFAELMNETLTLADANGILKGTFKASFQERGIITCDLLAFEAGDRVQRNLPNGRTEEVEIVEPIFTAAMMDIPAQCKLKYRRTGLPSPPVPKKATSPVTVEREGVYFAGQQFDAMLCVSKILAAAKTSIAIIDGYLGEDVLALLTSKSPTVVVSILTRPLTPALVTMAKAFNQQHGGLSIRCSQTFHDRFIIIDDAEFYHFGASIKDLGKRGFMFSRIEEPAMVQALRKQFQQEWSIATVAI